MQMEIRTSDSHPLQVSFLPLSIAGRVGLAEVPGKTAPAQPGFWWARSLDEDLDRLAEHYGARLLVCLLNPAEQKKLKIPDFAQESRNRDLEFLEFPISPTEAPEDPKAVHPIVERINQVARQGDTVVIHSSLGQGRAGTIAGCCLIQWGYSAQQSLEILNKSLGFDPLTKPQREFVLAFEDQIAVRIQGAPSGEFPAPPIDDLMIESQAEEDETEPETIAEEEVIELSEEVSVEEASLSVYELSGIVSEGSSDSSDRFHGLTPKESSYVGAVLGAAIGDALGHPLEFVESYPELKERFGPQGLEGYELYWERNGRRFAPYTDDTQLAEAVLRTLLERRQKSFSLDQSMVRLGERLVAWSRNPQGGHRAPGKACLEACAALEAGAPWQQSGSPKAGGCGSVMRAYPLGLLFPDDLGQAEHWSVAQSKLTHRDPIALAACSAMSVGIGRILLGQAPEYVISEMVAAACRYSVRTAGMMVRAFHEAQSGIGPEVTLERLRGWAAHEAISAALYVFARHPEDPEAALLEAAFTPGDSDSIATLVGALVGARCGAGKLPVSWVEDLERNRELEALAKALASGRSGH